MVFGALPIFNVDTRSVPLAYVPLLVAQRHFPVQEPTILAIGTPHACFSLKGFSSRQRRPPLGHEWITVFGMNRGRPPPALDVLQAQPQKLQPALIEEIKEAVRPSAVDQRGCCVDDEAK